MRAEVKQNYRKKKGVRACSVCEYKFDVSRSQCPSCSHWNVTKTSVDGSDQTVLLSEVTAKPLARVLTGPWDRCFGGPREADYGIVTTSVVLIGGVPGAGKSTMALQLADKIASTTLREIVYVGAEESAEEIKYRAMRLNLKCLDKIRIHPMGSSADLGAILLSRKPSAVIVDSLPGLVSDPEMGVELCKRFKDYAVELQAPVIVIDHVNKDEDFAGLMALQHAVDTLVTLNRDDRGVRYLTTIKNRFGPANMSVVLEMREQGLFMGKDDDDDDANEDYNDVNEVNEVKDDDDCEESN